MHPTTRLVHSLDREVLSLELQKSRNMQESFAYSCSHGIRSPLKSLAGIVMLMKDYPNARLSNGESYLTLISSCVRRMEDVLVQFEELSASASNAFRLERVNIKSFFNMILKSQKAGIGKHSISFSFHINQKGQFYSDKKRLEMIFTRVISNAISFADPTRNKKTINIFVTASPSGCSIQVRDNGMGIPASEQPRIFDLFHRGSVQSSGTGMGLFVAKQVAESLGGVITVQSTETIGSTFSVWIPNLAAHVLWRKSSVPAHNESPKDRKTLILHSLRDQIKPGAMTDDHMEIAHELDHANALTEKFIRNYALKMRAPVGLLSTYAKDLVKKTGHSPTLSGIEMVLTEMEGILTSLLAELNRFETATSLRLQSPDLCPPQDTKADNSIMIVEKRRFA